MPEQAVSDRHGPFVVTLPWREKVGVDLSVKAIVPRSTSGFRILDLDIY